ncbi:MAG: hypothetical protein J1F03_08335 [Oscillospiraceae bacterium]|nr:hypothetical protein [Oscillospiraceae bacterium]
MKLKYILSAAAVFGSLTVSAFAANAEDSSVTSESEAAAESGAVSESEVSSENEAVLYETRALDGDGITVSVSGNENVDTGAGGVAAVVGIITLAGAAVAISRKKS